MSLFWDISAWLLALAKAGLFFVVEFAKNQPVAAALALVGFLRLFGILIPTGCKGLLFVFGRVRKELEPGFHPLLPIILTARMIPVRSITLDLPRQRLTTADGLVFDVEANMVYRVVDVKLAFIQIDSLFKGIATLLPLVLEELLRDRTRADLLDFKTLEAEFGARAEQRLRRWGVAVEQAGFKSLTPSPATLRLTQLALLADERQRVLQFLAANDVPPRLAIPLLGAERCLVAHSSARYRALHHRPRLGTVPLATALLATLPLASAPQTTDGALAAQPESAAAPAPATSDTGAEAPAPAETAVPSRGPQRNSAKGMQPRSWQRLKARLQRALHRTAQAPMIPPQASDQPGA